LAQQDTPPTNRVYTRRKALESLQDFLKRLDEVWTGVAERSSDQVNNDKIRSHYPKLQVLVAKTERAFNAQTLSDSISFQ
jgi:hypothetical protein